MHLSVLSTDPSNDKAPEEEQPDYEEIYGKFLQDPSNQ